MGRCVKSNSSLGIGLLVLVLLAVTSPADGSVLEALSGGLIHLESGGLVLQQNATSTATSYRKVVDIAGQTICALDRPWKNWHVAGGPDQCADACTNHLEGCIYFNYKTGDRCDLYDCFPLVYDVVSDCSGYQREDTVLSCQPDANGAIPARCCSFPFTWNGNVQYSCAPKSVNDRSVGCLLNGQWFQCQQPANYLALWESVILSDSSLVFAVNQWIIASNKVQTGGTTSFNQPWIGYKTGFGVLSLNDNYWIGLNQLHSLTANGKAQLRVEIQRQIDGKWYSAEYSSVTVGDETAQFQLTFDPASYSGDAGDALSQSSNGMKFSAVDRDNDKCTDCQCAVDSQAGWWFSGCGQATPTRSPLGVWSTDQTPVSDVIASRVLVKQGH